MGQPNPRPPRAAPDARASRRRRGPLGQGTANAVGMAIAERFLAARYNRPGHEIVNHRTFALVGDGDLMEGISSEAGSLAGHLKLGKLTYLYDDNHVSLDGPTSQLHRGRPAPLRGLRLAGAARRERQHGLRRDRRRDPDRRLAGGAADDHRRPHDDRLRLAAQGRDLGRARQPPRRRGSGPDEEGARLGVDRGVLRAARGREELPHGARARHEVGGRLGPPLRSLGEGLSGSGRGVADRPQGRAARGAGTRTCRSGRRATRSRRAWPAARP